jgi:hypothetical protein
MTNNPDLTASHTEDTPEWALVSATRAVAVETARLADAAETDSMIAYLKAAYQGGLAYRPSAEVLKSVQAQIETRLGLA